MKSPGRVYYIRMKTVSTVNMLLSESSDVHQPQATHPQAVIINIASVITV
jgi:hypothetical protein